METLIIILASVFGGLFLLIKLTEGRAKPLDAETESKYSSIFMVLIGILLVASLIKYTLG